MGTVLLKNYSSDTEIFHQYERRRKIRENNRKQKKNSVRIIKIQDPTKNYIDNCDSESGGEDDRCEVKKNQNFKNFPD